MIKIQVKNITLFYKLKTALDSIDFAQEQLKCLLNLIGIKCFCRSLHRFSSARKGFGTLGLSGPGEISSNGFLFGNLSERSETGCRTLLLMGNFF